MSTKQPVDHEFFDDDIEAAFTFLSYGNRVFALDITDVEYPLMFTVSDIIAIAKAMGITAKDLHG